MKTVIEKVTYSGKWIEYWTRDREDKSRWDMSSKNYMFWDVVKKAGLTEYVETHGVEGIILYWDETEHPERVELPLNRSLTFKEVYKMQLELNPGLESWETDTFEFYSKCADIYAQRFHRQQMEYYKHVDVLM